MQDAFFRACGVSHQNFTKGVQSYALMHTRDRAHQTEFQHACFVCIDADRAAVEPARAVNCSQQRSGRARSSNTCSQRSAQSADASIAVSDMHCSRTPEHGSRPRRRCTVQRWHICQHAAAVSSCWSMSSAIRSIVLRADAAVDRGDGSVGQEIDGLCMPPP